MSKKKIIIHQMADVGTGIDVVKQYDTLYPDTSIDNINSTQEIADAVGASATDGQSIMESISSTDKMISGYGVTAGTAKAYTLSLEGKPDMAIVDGMMIRAKFHVTSDEEPTIDVNGSGAKNIYGLNQLKILYAIGAGVWAILMYSASLDGWIVQGWAKKKVYHTEIITETTSWKVPEYVGSIGVRLFGGGAGGQNGNAGGVMLIVYCSGSGGGGGHMAFGNIKPRVGENVIITIGAGGSAPATSTAELWGGSGGTTSFGNYLSANGGSKANGGSGGGDGNIKNNGGNGSYGGGGGGCRHSSSTGTYYSNGGNGGTYGGGGYGYHGGSARNGMFTSAYRYGAGYMANATSTGAGGGLSTKGMGLDFEGEGKAGSGGGGGYGGNGGSSGGGGYGSSGGNGTTEIGGGGGGYGGNGGHGGVNNYGGGGGGGYGASGNGGSGGNNAGYAAGGCGGDMGYSTSGQAGGGGVCVLSYWSWDVSY